MSFCHLHTHDEYSLLDGFGKTSDYVKEVKEKGQKFLAVTNHGSIDGLIKLQKECEKQGVKPIFGCENYIVEDATVKEKGMKNRHILLLVKNETGWRNLCKLMTYANGEGFYNRPRIDTPMLLKYCEGLMVGTACAGSYVGYHWGRKLFIQLLRKIGEDVFIEIMPHDETIQNEINAIALDLHNRFGARLVATNDCHYIKSHQAKAQEVLLAINTNGRMNDSKRFKFEFTGLFLRSEAQMERAFRKQKQIPEKTYKEAIANTVWVAERCSGFKLKKTEVKLPHVKRHKKKSDDQLLESMCLRGLRKMKLSERAYPVYKRRLYEELNLIKKKKFAAYFLLVKEDIIDYADRKGIGRGPGRGSVGCSLVARLLDITLVDPIEYDLPFHRFIAEDRIDFPDIDMDFEDVRVGEIRTHLEKKFGKKNVFGTSTFTTMKGKGVIRDVSRVYSVPLDIAGAVAGLIDETLAEQGEHTAVASALKEEEDLKLFKKKYPEVIESAIELEGQKKAASQHPAAVVVTPKELRKNVILVRRKGKLVSNWDMDDLEYVGLIKFDILALKTLSIIYETIKLTGKEIDLRTLPLNDPKVFDEMNKGNVVGVFQLSGKATASILQRIKVENFLHVSDTIALSRPGPKDSGMTDEYIRRRHGGEWDKLHPIYEEVLEDTYGVVVYQEQVMSIISEVAGLPYTTADKIRKVIGKKRSSKEFAPFKAAFVDGCRSNKTLSRKEAKEFWQGLLKHARYSFNKAHSIAYSVLAYWCQWLKYYYPKEFMCAALTHTHKDKKQEVVDEAVRLGFDLVPPKVFKSSGTKWIARKKKIYAPFMELDGIGPKTVEKLTLTREGFYEDDIEGKPGRILSDAGCYRRKDMRSARKYMHLDLVGVRPVTVMEKSFKINKAQLKCKLCRLQKECTLPVQPSPGIYNIMIVGEAPGFYEDRDGMGFVGASGDLLWNYLAEFGLQRHLFHVTNMCKCYPKKSKTPTKEEIILCRDKWFLEEVNQIKPKLILALGNTGLKAFLDQDSGIKSMSGKIRKIDNRNVVFCLHPAAVFRDREENMPIFERGMKKFVDELVRAKGFNELMM